MARDNDFNLDPITKAPGAHPVGTGLGAAAGGVAAGAAAGTVVGPVGTVIGAVAGALVGGLGGKAAAEAVNPTAEEAYWRENHTSEPYYESGRSFDDYAPAYRLGLLGRGEYGGSFDQTENRLAEDWDAKKEGSTLSWPQARAASQAAWNRLDNQQGMAGSEMGEDADEDDVIDTLNDLLEVCRDGEYGFRESAKHAEAQDIKTVMERRADDCASGAAELQTLITQRGGEPDEGGSVIGSLHRGWVSVKGTLSGYSDKVMLDECERGEDAALATYRKALKQNLPADVKAVVERQVQGVQRNHDQIKSLRDALKS